jgi:NAD(P)-dependent dehydrogenase (short-subunit alcohol dehydrogenase family)
MARLDTQSPSLNLPSSLSDSVIVLTGGSQGIGLATLHLLCSYGGHVVYGDVTEPASSPAPPANSTWVQTDVSKYESILKLFQTALDKHGRIDHAISNAGILERPGWFDSSLGIDGLKQPPPMAVEEVNLRGTLWFSHIACQFLAHNANESQAGDKYQNKSLTLISSIAAYKETPGLFIYEAAKAGIVGLLRSLRLYLPTAFKVPIRVNAVCPSATDTGMIAGIKKTWKANDARINTPEDVAKVVTAICAAGRGSQSVWYDGPNYQGTRRRRNRGGMDWDDDEREARGMSGRSWMVLEGEAWDLEEGLDRTEDLWMGLSSSDRIEAGQKSLGIGGEWLETGGAKGEEKQVSVVSDAAQT